MTNCTQLLRCLACDGESLTTYLDLGWQPLANDYHTRAFELAEYPLAVNRCENCTHSQLTYSVDPDLMFANYDYVSGTTSTLAAYFDDFVTKVEADLPGRQLRVLDIAGNDGSLLAQFAKRGHEVLNVDPATNLTSLSKANGVTTHCGYWSSALGRRLDHQYDVVVAMNVLAHVINPLDFLIGCRYALADGGKLYVQTSQAEWLYRGDFDCVYSEHISYFTAQSFVTLAHRAGFDVQRVSKPSIHGISYLWELTELDLHGQSHSDGTVPALLEWEFEHGVDDERTYDCFGQSAKETVEWLAQVTDLYGDAGFAVCGYGAAAKGNTILNFGQVGLDFIVDDNPMKVGKYTPGMNIPVCDPSALGKIDDRLCCVILSWNFATEIIGKIKQIRNRSDDVFVQVFPSRQISQ